MSDTNLEKEMRQFFNLYAETILYFSNYPNGARIQHHRLRVAMKKDLIKLLEKLGTNG